MTEANSTRISQRAASIRTALILGLLALVFFVAIVAARRFEPLAIWLGTLGFAVIGFPLAVMVGRRRAR